MNSRKKSPDAGIVLELRKAALRRGDKGSRKIWQRAHDRHVLAVKCHLMAAVQHIMVVDGLNGERLTLPVAMLEMYVHLPEGRLHVKYDGDNFSMRLKDAAGTV